MKRLIFILFLVHSFVVFSQNSEVKQDSITMKNSWQFDIDSAYFQTNDSLLYEISRQTLNMEKIRPPEFVFPDFPKFRLNKEPSFSYFDSEYLQINPFHYGFYDWLQGGEMAGVNSHFQFTNYLWSNLNVSVSSSYAGFLQPERYNNASVSLDLTLQFDRIRLRGFGQLSMREGINPLLNPAINGGNYYGGEIQFRVYKNIGVGVGIVNYYYRNNWMMKNYAMPVVY